MPASATDRQADTADQPRSNSLFQNTQVRPWAELRAGEWSVQRVKHQQNKMHYAADRSWYLHRATDVFLLGKVRLTFETEQKVLSFQGKQGWLLKHGIGYILLSWLMIY